MGKEFNAYISTKFVNNANFVTMLPIRAWESRSLKEKLEIKKERKKEEKKEEEGRQEERRSKFFGK